MRILLISGIVFVHVPFGTLTRSYLGTYGLFDWLRVFLGDSLFRIGVPCLSAISGYLLFVRGWEKFDYLKTLRSKARTVLLPFLLWNGALFVAVLAVQDAGMGVGYFPDLWHASPLRLLTYAFAVADFPVNIPLYFLRDLLVCILLSPILARCVRRAPALTLAALFIVAVVPNVPLGIVLKDSILFSFTFGIFLALNKVDLKSFDRHAAAGTIAVLVAAALLSVGLYQTGPYYPWMLDLARNTLSILGAGGLWLMSALAIQTRAGQALARTGSLSFWIFCAHYPLLLVMWMVWNRVAGENLYPLFYISALLASFVILVTTNHLVPRIWPGLYEALTGSRGRKQKLGPAANHAPHPSHIYPGEPAVSEPQR
jgi:succinoglycan biosynthesis protein ExoH